MGSRMRSMFHLTESASIVSPLWNSAPRRSLKVQVLRSYDGSHRWRWRAMLHAVVEVEQPAGGAGQRLGDEVDEVAMGIEADGIVSRAETHGAAALWVALALSLGDAGQSRERSACERRRRGKKLTPVLSGPFLFASSVMDAASQIGCLGRSWLCGLERLLDRLPPHGHALDVRSPSGQTYWCAVQNSVPSFPVKVNAQRRIK